MTAVDCGQCGTGNRDGARFCRACGSSLARRCGSCSAELAADARFCDECGTPVAATAAPIPAPTVAPVTAAVRKTVSVLFADLGGSTGFGERTDPEIARQVLARYHALLQEAIDDAGGTVAKFMGDGMMATFGIPEIAEDDAHRAVRAGIDIQLRFESFAAEVETRHGEVLALRVGVNTGEVVIAAGDADLVGDALNVAARLEKACRPGHVLVGDETWRITRGELTYEPLGEVTVAGRAGPVSTYEVVASSAATSEPAAPFVGRAGETARLLAAFDQARADETAVLVTVLGSPGMGKTRLSREVASTLAADAGATTFEIRCDRSGGATFAPFADLVRAAAGISEVEDVDDTRVRIAALVCDDADRGRVVDVIAGVLGAAPARSVEETFWGVRRVVESLATDRPLVMVIDDIQWAEPKLLDLLEHLAEWVQTAAVLLVCLARPELRELRPALTETGRRVTDVVALDGLDASATAELASSLLGSALPSELVDRLPASTDGNPLFVRELVRMLVDDAVIRRGDDATWELAIDAGAIEVPPTIQSLLATRVERLPAEELRVLELASVVGAEFSVGALRELAGDDIAVPTVLERLRHKELVEPTGSYWGDDPLHRFHHVLIRDATYRRLLKTTRAELHRRVGAWTDAIAADLVGEQETAIAFHYEQSHRYRMELGTADDETDRLGRRAAELLSVAARRALDREDLTSAGALARRALAAVPDADVDDRADLLLIACECFLSSGDIAAGAPLVDALDELAGGNEQLAAWSDCYRAQLVGLTDPEGVVAAEEMATAAAATLERLGDGAGEAKAHQVRAGLLARLGRVGEAEVVLDLALGAARASDDRRRVTAVLGAAPQAALFGPSPVARAGGRCLDVVRLLRITTASPSVEATSMRCQAVLEALRGRFDVSRSMLASARASLEELGLRHGLLETDLFTGMVELIADDPAAAIGPLRAAYEGLGTLGVGADAGQAAALLATALLACGETDEAELMAGESEALAGQNLKTAIAWRIARAEVLAARGDLDAGTALAAEAVDIAGATDLVLDHADACVVLADLCAHSGDVRGAEQARVEARRLYEAKGATVPAERLATVVARPVDPVPASAARAEPRIASTADATRTPLVENAMSRLHTELCAAINRRDFETQRRLVAPEFAQEDRRPLIGLEDLDRRGMAENHDLMLEQGYEIVPPEPIAVRGERFALALARARTAAGDESALLALNVLSRDGRLVRTIVFDEHAIDDALTDLDARYIADEGGPDAAILRAGQTMNRLFRERDWGAYRASLTDEFRFVDHRNLGFGSGGPDDLVEVLQSGVAVAPDMTQVARKVFVAEAVGLTVLEGTGRSDDGGEHQWLRFGLTQVADDGRLRGLEWFDEDDFDAALARFDELVALPRSDPRGAEAQNATSRMQDQVRLAVNAGDFEALGLLVASDYVQEDRRALVGLEGLETRVLMEESKARAEQGFVIDAPQVIAVRGERLSLARTIHRTEGGDETSRLGLMELDLDGRLARAAFFDDRDLAGALAELDARYLAGEGAPFERVLRACGRFAIASAHSDFDAMRELLAPDFVYVDRQPLGSGEGDRNYFTNFMRTRMAAGSQVNRVVYVGEHALLTVQDEQMFSDQGSIYERSVCIVLGIDADDRINRFEVYAEDEFATALARFDELGVNPPTAVGRADVENTATRIHARVCAAIRAGRPEDLRPLLTHDFVQEDRRTLVALPTLARPGLAEHLALMQEQGFVSMETQPIAVRGERLCLERGTARTRGGDESTLLRVVEVDEDGRETRNVVFDEDDLPAALAELDVSYVAGEGATHADALMVCGAFAAAALGGDADRMRELMAPNFVVVDRQLLGFGEGDGDYFVDVTSTRIGGVDGSVVNRVLHVAGNAVLAVQEWEQVGDGGTAYERVVCYLLVVDTDGLINRLELSDVSEFPAAVARLDELGAPSPEPQTAVLENLATRVHARILAAINVGDADAQRALTTRTFAHDDRRAVVAVPDQGRRGMAPYYGIMIEQGIEILPPEPLAVRGERLTLARATSRTVAGDESILLALIELDVDGLIARATAFDDDDLAAALAELDARYLAGEGADHAELLGACARFKAASSSDDLDAPRALMSPDFVIVDHTLLGFGTGDREYYLAMRASWAEVSVAGRSVVRRIEVVDGALLAVQEDQVVAEDGGTYERCRCYVLAVDASRRITRFELYEEQDLPAARARLHEFGASDTADRTDAPYRPENQVTRIIGQALEHLNRKDWDSAFAMSFLADDIERFDRRRTVSAPTVDDVLGFLANATAIYDVFETVTPEVVAVRGERLALIRLHCGHAPDFGLLLLCVYEFDASGLLWREADFDDDDLDAALRELDDRYATQLDRDHGYVALRLGDLVAIANRADADGYRELFTDDCEFANHRRLSWPVDTMDDAIVWARSLSGVARHVIAFPDVELGLDAALVWQEEQFATRQESEYAGLTILVLHLRAGRFDVFESYDPEDEPAARARFAELVEASRFTPHVDNWLVRLTERNGWLARHTDDRPLALAADCVLDDRRVGVNAGAVTGDVDVDASIQSGIDVFGGLDLEPLAVRGERLALYRWAFVTDGGFEAPGLCVVEMGDDDLTQRITSFDDADIADAVDYLEERSAARAGEVLTRGVELLMSEGQRSVNHADFDALAALVPPDISFESHLTLGVATTRDTYLVALRLLVEQTATVAVVFAKMYLTPRSSLAAVSFVGTTPEGNRYEWSYAQVAAAAATGRVTHIAVFDAERWDDAVARFDELTAATVAAEASVATVRPATVDNAAARALVRAGELLMTDVEAALELFAEDAQSENRQAGPLHGVTAVGRDGWRTALTSWADTYQAVRLEPVAVRGERLALVRYEFEADGFVTRALGVVETDGQGQVRRLVNFDEDDFDAAVNELDERCAATVDVARVPETNAPSAAGPDWLLDPMAQAFARRDWDWIRGHTAPDVELHDHRSTVSSHHVTGIDAVIDLLGGFADVGFETLENIRVAGRGDRLGLIRRVSRTATGFELDMLAVIEFGPTGLASSLVLFDADALVPALDELDIRYARSGALTRPERQVLLGFAGLNHRVWAELEAVLAPDVELADHRRLGWPGSSGKEHLVRELQSLVAQVADVVAIVQDIEVSGPAVHTHNHQVGTRTDGAAVDWAWHHVFAIGADGLITHMEYFDLDDGARARVRYDELAHPDVVERLVHRFVRVYNTRDWDGLRTTYPDLVMVDHRPASFGEMVGAQALVDYLNGLLALVPDLHVEVPEIAAVAEHGVVFRMVGSGHSTDGGDVEIDIVLCSTIVGGQVRAETFPADAMDAARECWLDAGA